MTPTELLARLDNEEDNFVERKSEGIKPAEIRKTTCAFANQLESDETGILFIGIGNNGANNGVQNPDKLQIRVRAACQQDCYPPIEYTSQVIEHKGVKIVAVVIPASDARPHFTGAAYLRVGSESKKATPALYEQLIASRNTTCGRLQRLGKTVLTVIAHKRLGDHTDRYAGNFQQGPLECKIVEVDAHSVRLKGIGSDRYYSEPLANIEITRDEEKHRPMLIVRQR